MIKNDDQPISALDAKSYAQFIAFGPFAFQAAVTMRDTGLLAAMDRTGDKGATIAELAEAADLTHYAVSVLTDFAVNLGIVETTPGERFALGRVGYFLLHDEMTRVNMNFTRDVNYDALAFLQDATREGRPTGLKTLGPWKTVYEGLTSLPEPAQTSWFEFDHFYSDRAFDQLLPLVFEHSPRHLLDVGGNTGRWALKCLEYDPNVHITLMDLPKQLEKAQHNLEAAGFADRVDYRPADLLNSETHFPQPIDTLWMSQFLDCFSAEEIENILTRAAQAMTKDSRLFIVELFPDRQSFNAARFSLDATSLYFTCVANGNSRMYHYPQFRTLVENAGLVIETVQDLAGGYHTLLCCTKP